MNAAAGSSDSFLSTKTGESVICEEISKLRLSDVKCDKCHQNLDLTTKLQLEKLLNDSEDTDFKDDMTKRLDKIENLLTTLLNRSKPSNRSSRKLILPQAKLKKEYVEQENVFEDQFDEEHLVEAEETENCGFEVYEEKSSRQMKEVLANVNDRFPITSTQAMEELNQDLISDSTCLEEVVRLIFINFEIILQLG